MADLARQQLSLLGAVLPVCVQYAMVGRQNSDSDAQVVLEDKIAAKTQHGTCVHAGGAQDLGPLWLVAERELRKCFSMGIQSLSPVIRCFCISIARLVAAVLSGSLRGSCFGFTWPNVRISQKRSNQLLFGCPFADGTDVLPYDVNDPRQLDLYPAYGTPAKKVGSVPFWKRLLWEGGRPFDAFLTIVSAQVCPLEYCSFEMLACCSTNLHQQQRDCLRNQHLYTVI